MALVLLDILLTFSLIVHTFCLLSSQLGSFSMLPDENGNQNSSLAKQWFGYFIMTMKSVAIDFRDLHRLGGSRS